MNVEHFFCPKSVAVVGASREEGKVGNDTLKNLIQYGYQGNIYPVNPKAAELMGLKCYPDLLSIDGPIDLVIFVVPPPVILTMLDQCKAKKVDSAIIITAGFKEIGRGGIQLEKDLSAKAREIGMRVIGPNCLGIIDAWSNLNASFAAGMPARGGIGFFSQSGAMCSAILDWALLEGVGFSKFISVGNKMNIDEVDLVRVLGDDPDTKVILGYLEGVKDGPAFMKTAREISLKKPIIIFKSGTTQAGAKAASSHTGTLAGSDNAYTAAFIQTGVIRAVTIESLFDMALAFSFQPLPKGPNLAVITNAGGPGIITADAVERSSVKLATLSKETVDVLRASLPPTASLYNPIDVIGDARADRYGKTLEAVVKDPNVNAVLVLLTPQAMSQIDETADMITNIKSDKPILASFMGGVAVKPGTERLLKHNVPNYQYPERAVSALEVMHKYAVWKQQPASELKRFEVSSAEAKSVLQEASADGNSNLGELEARRIIAAYGFNVPQGVLCASSQEAADQAERIGFPVVMKIASPDILHKSDIGGVRVGLESAEDVATAYYDIVTRAKRFMPKALIRGVSVQEMVTGGKEVILGMVRDSQFGPMLMFGLGGIYVEVMKDVSFRIAPITERDAKDMISEIKAYPLLRGVRGEESADLDAVVEALLRLSQLVTDWPEIIEMDINPLKVFPKGKPSVAIDARLSIHYNSTAG